MPLADPRSTVAARPTKPRCRRLREECADADKHQASDHCRKARQQQERQPNAGQRQGTPKGGPRAKSLRGRAGERGGHDRRQEHEVYKAQCHAPERGWLAHQHKVYVGKGAYEREQDTKSDAKARQQSA